MMKELHLISGQTIKNLKDLSELLGVKYTKGKGRNYLIKELERYCTYHKEGQKFIVEEVYKVPLPKQDGRKNNGGNIANTTYEDLMDNLIIDLLIDINEIDNVTFGGFFTNLLPLFSESYTDLMKEGYVNFANKNEMSRGLVLLYSQKIKNIVEKCFVTSLNRLQKNNLIVWKRNIIINDSGYGLDIADEELVKTIKDCEARVLEDMEITHFNRTNPKVNKEFKKEVCKELDEYTDYNIFSYWNAYNIKSNVGLKDDQDIETDIDELIVRFIKTLHKSIENKSCTNDFGRVYYPYRSSKHQEDILSLDRLIWNVPINYDELFLKDMEHQDNEYIPF